MAGIDDRHWAAFRLGQRGHDLPPRCREDMMVRLWFDMGRSHRRKEQRAAGLAAPAPFMDGGRYSAVSSEIKAVEASDRDHPLAVRVAAAALERARARVRR